MDPPELPDEILALDEQLQNGIDILYLGDSTLIYPTGEPTIPEILREMRTDYAIGDVAHPAYNLDLYERYVNYLVANKYQVESVIIPINMRSFSPEWDLRPSYQFEREKAILTYGPRLSTLFYRPFDTFGLFDSPISQDDFQHATVFNGDQPVGDVAEFEELLGIEAVENSLDENDFAYYASTPSDDEIEVIKGTLVYYYMNGLDDHHRKIQSLKATSRLLTENGIKPIFYITPINYELGEQHMGDPFREQVTENTAIIERILSRKGVDVLNLAFDLEAYNFVDTEHLTENGKSYVAKTLAEAIGASESDEQPSVNAEEETAPRISMLESAVSSTATPDEADQITSTATPAATSPVEPTPTDSPTAIPTPTLSVAAQQAGQLVSIEYWTSYRPDSSYALDIYRLRYKSVDQNDQVTEIDANLYVPKVDEPTEFPVFVYAPGTTGLSDACAPLNERTSVGNWGAYHSYMLEYSSQGFIGILPNYQGFNEDDSQPHPYFISELQGRALLDAARVAFNLSDQAPDVTARPMDAVIMAGYSSGGHAVFAAKDIVAEYAPDIPLKGVIGHGPTTNVEALMDDAAVFSPYIVQSYRDFYGDDIVDPADIFLDRWLNGFENHVMTRCVDSALSYYSYTPWRMYRPEFLESLEAGTLQETFPEFKEVLDTNNAGLAPEGADIPVLILQGTGDQVVTPPTQMEFAAGLCGLDNHVTYISYSAVDHPNIRRASFRDTINWIKNAADGTLPESNCNTFNNP